MSDASERIERAQWVLERNLHWIAAAEVKTGVVVALNTATLGALAAAFGAVAASERTPWAHLSGLVAAGCFLAALFCAAMVVLPRTTGPVSSLIFFGRIAGQRDADYQQAFHDSTDQQFLVDCLSQAHRNAEIARDKFVWVQRSMKLSFAGVLPWIVALANLVGA